MGAGLKKLSGVFVNGVCMTTRKDIKKVLLIECFPESKVGLDGAHPEDPHWLEFDSVEINESMC